MWSLSTMSFVMRWLHNDLLAVFNAACENKSLVNSDT